MVSASTKPRKDLLAAYLGQLIPAIQQAIIDDDDSVRNQASTAALSSDFTCFSSRKA